MRPLVDALMSSSAFPPQSNSPTTAGEPKSGPACRGTILVVDDDPLTGTILSTWLREKGYQAHLAASPEEADRVQGATSFDLVISDVYMPGNFRLEWVERFLQRASVPPILLVTGTPDLETACRAANLPVAGYLLKPLDFTILDEVVRRILEEQIRRRDFIHLAQEAIQMLTGHGGEHSPEETRLASRLAGFCTSLQSQSGRAWVDRTADEAWRAAVAETIGVLEKTKHSFRSKDLGQLRLRLKQLLDQSDTS